MNVRTSPLTENLLNSNLFSSSPDRLSLLCGCDLGRFLSQVSFNDGGGSSLLCFLLFLGCFLLRFFLRKVFLDGGLFNRFSFGRGDLLSGFFLLGLFLRSSLLFQVFFNSGLFDRRSFG